jgi:hypothetical protein
MHPVRLRCKISEYPDIPAILRLVAGRLNAQNYQLIFSRALRTHPKITSPLPAGLNRARETPTAAGFRAAKIAADSFA